MMDIFILLSFLTILQVCIVRPVQKVMVTLNVEQMYISGMPSQPECYYIDR